MSFRRSSQQDDANQPLSGLQLLLLGNMPLTAARPQAAMPRDTLPLSPAMLTPLHRQLRFLCLHDPYRNDFYLLNHFQRRGEKVTLADIQRLKKECGLDDRQAICNTLLRLAACSGCKLNNRQKSYIGRFDPEYRDRDLKPSQPGELLAYSCLFGGGRLFDLGGGDLGRRVYIHLYVDLFTRYFFAKLSNKATLATGLNFLQETLLPVYRENEHAIQTVMHSVRNSSDFKEFDELESSSAISGLGLQWLPTRRKFGSIEKFERSISENNFLKTPANPADLFGSLNIAFQQWLRRYNASNRLRRTISEY